MAPLADMWSFWRGTCNLWSNPSYGICTNLVFTLADAKLEFIETALQGQIGTSWDPSIRFANSQQYDLWFTNINILTSNPKNYVSLFINLIYSKSTHLCKLNISYYHVKECNAHF